MRAPARPDRWRPLWRITNRFESLELRWLGTSGITLLGRTDVLVLETTGFHPSSCFDFRLEYRLPFQYAAHRRRLKTGGTWFLDHFEYFSHKPHMV